MPTYAILVDNSVIQSIELSEEESLVIEDLLNRVSKDYLLDACDSFNPKLEDYNGNQIQKMCRQEVMSHFAISGEQCGTTDCLKRFKDQDIDCSKIDPTFVDDYYDNTIVEMCEYMYEEDNK